MSYPDSSAGTAERKRDRPRGSEGELASAPTARWAAAVAAEEQLGHDYDTTEGVATGADADAAREAYGGEYYLDEAYGEKLSRHHRQPNSGGGGGPGEGGLGGGRDDGEKVDVFVNPAMVQPPFFTAGDDFPPPDTAAAHAAVPGADGDGPDVDGALLASIRAAAQNTDMDIILPVVDPDSALALSATKGSQALAELRRLMTREKINREVMDTSKSDLAQLLRRDGTTGQQVDTSGDTSGDGGRKAGGRGRTAEAEAAEEEEALLRKIRVERRALEAAGDKVDGAVTVASPHGGSSGSGSNAADARQRAKVEKVEGIQAAQRRLEADAAGDAARGFEVRQAALRAQRESLPIYRCKRELMRYIGENPVTVLVGETGSGKTTQLVQYLHEAGYAAHGKIIGCTQPRRLAAMGVARRVSEEMGCALGTTVGYSIHLDDTTTDETEVKFMTDGVMLREVIKDPNVGKYSVIVLDEAHERSVDTDVLMGVLKLAIRRRGDLKLIVTSATMDISKFSSFFGNAPFYEIPGQTYDVDIRYAAQMVTDYVAESVFRVCQLHLQAPREGKHDILVFMTGRDDVYGTCELIKRRLQEMGPKYLDSLIVLPCLSEAASLTAADGDSIGVLDPTPAGKRKVVVATNVAETSLTIDGVRYVIDCGFMKTNVFRPKIGMNTLQRYPVSQAQAGQRKGRAGRTTAGVCFRLYTEEQFTHEMLPNSIPEIQRSSVDSVVLLLKSIGVRRLVDFDFMDPPPAANTRNSMWHLWLLGLLDGRGSITEEGRLALEFPMSPVLAKLLIMSTKEGCSLEMVRIVAVITADPKGLFELPKGKEDIAQQHHGRFFNNESDHLTLLNTLTQFLENGRSWQWAQDHFLHAPTLLRACDVLEQLTERLQRLRLPIVACGSSGFEKLRRCIARAFCLQAAQRSGSNWNEYRPLLNVGVVCTLHPSSSVCSRAEMPPFLVYNDLLLVSSREYLVMVTAVEPEWLVESGSGLYSMRRGGRLIKAARATASTASEATAQEGRPEGAGRVGGAPRAPAPAAPKKAPPSKFGFTTGRRRANI